MHVEGEGHSTAETIAELNAFILEAEEQGSRADLAPLLTRDFIIIRAIGLKQNRDTFLDAVPGGADRGRTADQPEVRLHGDCAVFTCRVTTTRNPDGSLGGGSFWNTRVFVRDLEGWRCAAWQVTEISELDR